jgi:hypothetical protein
VRRAVARLARGRAERPPTDRIPEGAEHKAGQHTHTPHDRHGIPKTY